MSLLALSLIMQPFTEQPRNILFSSKMVLELVEAHRRAVLPATLGIIVSENQGVSERQCWVFEGGLRLSLFICYLVVSFVPQNSCLSY